MRAVRTVLVRYTAVRLQFTLIIVRIQLFMYQLIRFSYVKMRKAICDPIFNVSLSDELFSLIN